MGLWIGIAVALFVIGNVMALKPGGVEMRLDKLRMGARKLGLNPKLIACPDWVRGKNNELGKGMIGQYSIVVEDAQLPQTYYQVLEGKLRPVSADIKASLSIPSINKSDINDSKPLNPANYVLDQEPLQLPGAISPHVKAVYSKANSVVIFWEDANYVKPITNPNYTSKGIEPDLIALRERLKTWADKLATTP